MSTEEGRRSHASIRHGVHLSLDRFPGLVGSREAKSICVEWLEAKKALVFSLFDGDGSTRFGESTFEPNAARVSDLLRDMSKLLYDLVLLEATDPRTCKMQLEGVGATLFNTILPEQLGCTVRDWVDDTIVQISTNEAWIPWELLYDGHGHLGRRFQLFRAPRARRSTEPDARSGGVHRVVHVVGGGLDDHRERAHRHFRTVSGAIVKERSRLEELIDHVRDADVLHFTCHGHEAPTRLQVADSERIGECLLVTSMASAEFVLKPGCLVFANACGSAAPSRFLGDLVDFGRAFSDEGAAVFIGTIGTVPTKPALDLAERFYSELARNGDVRVAFNEAMRKTSGIAGLFYVFQGDPLGHRVFRLHTSRAV